MKIKLDENFGATIKQIFLNAGFDVHTVYDEGLRGVSDIELYRLAVAEKRCFITMDKDFAEILRFDPQAAYGIVVVRIPNKATIEIISQIVVSFIKYLSVESPSGNLWIVESDKIRIHQNE